MHVDIPIDLYVGVEDKLDAIESKINNSSKNFISGNDQIGSAFVGIKQNAPNQLPNQKLLMLTEKLKIILIAKATGHVSDEQEYNNCREVLLNEKSVAVFVPSFINFCTNLNAFWTILNRSFLNMN